MKNCNIISVFFLFILVSLGLGTIENDLYAQNKKNRARINADYVKVIDSEHYLNIKASARVDKQTVEVSNVELIISQLIEEEGEEKEIEIGKTTTNSGGVSKFVIEDFKGLVPDSNGFYHLLVSFGGNDSFKKASREVSFKNAAIEANWVVKDSVNYVNATLTDTQLDSALADMPLKVRVDRLFRPLKIGKDFYETDEDGEIEVAVEDGIPGIDGNLKLEVVLSESDDYGTVIAQLTAPIGTVIVDESTFDKRTMWSPRGKTPIFLLSLTYSFIFIVWGIFLYLFINLVRIIKS